MFTGKKVLLNVAGKDATTQFDQFHKLDVLTKHKHLCIGDVGVAAKAEEEKPKGPSKLPKDMFGELVPYGGKQPLLPHKITN